MKGTTAVPPEPVSQADPLAPIDTVAMDKHLIGGIAWTAAARWSSQILTWGCLLILARLLLPSDFGLVGVAAVYLGLVKIFSEFGFGTALITLRGLDRSDVAQINAFSAVSGLIGFLVSCALAQPLGWFFRFPQLPGVIVVMSTTFLIAGFKTVPYSILQRELQFKRLSLIDMSSAMTQSLCILLLAWMGAGYWALVLGNVAGEVVATGCNVALRPQGFAIPRLKSIGHALNFSWQLLVARLSWNFYSDADFLVAGRVLGASLLGAYTFAWNLANLPVEKVTSLVSQVTPAFFSANQSDHLALRRYLRNLTEAIALVAFPASVGLGLVAPEFVPLVLGRSWSGVVAPLEVLAFYAAIRSVSALLGPLLTALHETRLLMWNNLAAAIVMPTAFYLGSRWGTAGIACGWIVAYPFIALPLYVRAFGRIGISVRAYLGALLPALNGSLALFLAVCIVKWIIPARWPVAARFAVEVTAGGGAYMLVLALLYADRIRSFISLWRNIRVSNRAIAAG